MVDVLVVEINPEVLASVTGLPADSITEGMLSVEYILPDPVHPFVCM